jgi:hypothetical protein
MSLCSLLQKGAGWELGRARLHVVVTAPAPRCGISEGVAPGLVFKVKPECFRKHKSRGNVIDRSWIKAPFRHTAALRDQTNADVLPSVQGRDFTPGRRNLRTGRPRSQPSLRLVPTFAERFALARHQDDPISHHIASTKGDLLSWLRPENGALAGLSLRACGQRNLMKNCHRPRGGSDWSNSFDFKTALFVTTVFSTLRLFDWEDIEI